MLKRKQIFESIKPLDKKGQVGLDTARNVMLALLTIGVIAFAIIVALSSLNNSNALSPGSLEQNQTSNVLNNITSGTADFFSNTGTWFSLLAIVVIILIIAIVIFAVNRFGGNRGL
jgi:uncharacterized membrane protein